MIAWMLYTVVASALVIIAARSAEWTARIFGKPTRWIWAGAMVASISFGIAAPVRQATRAVESTNAGTPIVLDALPLQAGIDAVNRQVPHSMGAIVAAAWTCASLLLVAIVFAVHSRVRVARRAWPLADLHGARVRLSPNVGPVVIGVRRPEIVVPQWLLAHERGAQEMVIAHEAEHVRAHDTLVLGAGVVAIALMPWNLALWYAFTRLRLAVELDCDARVLRRGIPVESYGSLLLDVATQVAPFRFGVAAVSSSPSHLRQRIVAMKHIVPKYARLRGGLVGVVGAAALLAACEAKMPTGVDVEQMDVGSAVRTVSPLLSLDTVATYIVDGVEMSAAEARTLRPDEIGGIEVVKGGAQPKIVISRRTPRGVNAESRVASSATPALSNSLEGAPLVLINGKRSTSEALRALDRNDIESVEVVKGSAAVSAHPGFTAAELANGVIRVTLKPGR